MISSVRDRIELELLEENAVQADPFDQRVTLVVTERLEPFHLFWQSPIISTARIGKEILDDQTLKLYLEGSHAGAPVRTEANADRLLSYSLFPGQVVAVKGTNPQSKLFRLNAIRSPAPLTAFPHAGESKEQGSLSVMNACGPFAHSGTRTMNLQPLDLLLVHVREKKPDVLLLHGPFADQQQLDRNGGRIKYRDTDYTAEQWFKLQVDMVMEAVQDLDTQVLILPSLRDAHHSLAMYPQPRFTCSHPALGKVCFPSSSIRSLCLVSFVGD